MLLDAFEGRSERGRPVKKAVKKKVTGARNRITICLPGDLDQALRHEASTSPNGELTPVILRYIALGMGMLPGQSAAPLPAILPAVMQLGAAIDLVREADGGESEPLVTARQIYGLLLEKAIYVEGVSE